MKALCKALRDKSARTNVVVPAIFVFGAMAVLVCLAMLMAPTDSEWSVGIGDDLESAAGAGLGPDPVTPGIESESVSKDRDETEKVARSSAVATPTGEARREGVRGQVIDQQWQPVPGARILAVRTRTVFDKVHPRDYRILETVSGSDGRYAFDRLPAGQYMVVAVTQGLSGHSSRQVAGNRDSYRSETHDCDIIVVRSGEISGCVTGPDGKPVVGALVVPQSVEPLLVETDAAGRFTIRDIEVGSFSLTVTAPGFCPHLVSRVFTGTSDVEAVLDLGSTAHGIVRFEDEPVAGVRVSASGGYIVEAVTGSDGTFTIGPLEEGRQALKVTAEGYCAPCRRIDLGGDGDVVENIVFELEKAGGIRGKVTDKDTGDPIAGAWLRVQARGAAGYALDRRNASVRSDEAGRFTFDTLPSGEFILDVRSAGDYCPGYWHGGRIIEVAPGDVTEGLDVQLERGAQAVVSVRSESGETISGASLKVDPAGGGPRGRNTRHEHTAVENEDGTYLFSGIPPGVYRVRASCRGWITKTETFSVSEEREDETVEIEMKPAFSVSGKVVDPSGRGVSLAWVYLNQWARAVTADDGSFTLNGVTYKSGRFHVAALGYSSMRNKSIPLESGMTDIELMIHPETGDFIAGSVQDDLGRPLPQTKVSLSQWRQGRGLQKSTVTDAEGHFRFEGLLEGSADLWVQSTVGRLQGDDHYFEVNREDIVLTVVRHGRVRGTVTDAAGNPVSVFFAYAREIDEDDDEGDLRRALDISFSVPYFSDRDSFERGQARHCFTDGVFELTQVKAGEVVINIETREGVRAKSDLLTVEAGKELNGVAIKVPETGTLSGRVFDAVTLEPVADAQIMMRHKTEESRSRYYSGGRQRNVAATTDEEGKFLVKRIPEGAVCVLAVHPEYEQSREQQTAVTAGNETSGIEFGLGRGRVIKGHVRVGGAGKAGVSISIWGRSKGKETYNRNVNERSASNREGYYEIRCLPPGKYNVQANLQEDKSRVTTSRTVTLEQSSEAVCDFDFSSGCAIAGRVYVSGKPRGDVQVSVYLKTPEGEEPRDNVSLYGWSRSEDDGAFYLDHLTPGTYRMDARVNEPDGSSYERDMTVELGPGVTTVDVRLGDDGNCEISGIVYNGDQPADDVWVYCWAEGWEADGQCDAAGFFKFENVPSGKVMIYVMVDRYGSMNSQYITHEFNLQSGQAVRHDFRFESGAGTLTGRVTDNDRPVEDSYVTVRITEGEEEGSQLTYAFTDGNGEFRLENLKPGRYTVMIHDPRDVRQIAVVEDYKHTYVEFNVRSGKARLDGKVSLPEGEISGKLHAYLFEPGCCAWTKDAAFTRPTLTDGLIADTSVSTKKGEFSLRELPVQSAEIVVVLIQEGKIKNIVRQGVAILDGVTKVELTLPAE